MENTEIMKVLGFVKISPYRTNTLKSIGDELKMPSEIANEINIRKALSNASTKGVSTEHISISDNIECMELQTEQRSEETKDDK